MVAKQFTTKWKNKRLSWFFSGLYWYVTEVDRNKRRVKRSTPVGSGKSKDEAFLDFIELQKERPARR